MATAPMTKLVARSRASAWGFLVALPIASAFLLAGLCALAVNMTPGRVGVFVAPPEWLVGALFIAFSAFLFMIGIAELARYVRPGVELILDGDGIASFGLLGERRFAWRDVIAVDAGSEQVALKLQSRGRIPPPDLRIHFDRLDIERETILASIWANRPDLVPKRFSSIDA